MRQGAIVKDVQPVASPHQHQLAELMGMFGKDILRVANLPPPLPVWRKGKTPLLRKIRLATAHTPNADNGALFAFLVCNTLTLLALLKNGVAPLTDIARRPVELPAKKRRKVVTVAEAAAISDISHAFIAVAQQVAGFHQGAPD